VLDLAEGVDLCSAAPDAAERAVVDRARSGDEDAFRELVERHQDRIFRLAIRVLRCDRSTAEDLAQEVFLRAFRGLPRFDGAVRFGIWLHKIGLNACISEYRRLRTQKRGARRTLSIDAPLQGTDDLHLEPPSREPDPGARADQREFAERARLALEDLPEEFRHAVLLRDMQGLSYEEIGEVLGVPPGTVRSRIHRGRSMLQDILREFAE
jgi:RNA polymerase sigma-70 factor (ECF subfamily)